MSLNSMGLPSKKCLLTSCHPALRSTVSWGIMVNRSEANHIYRITGPLRKQIAATLCKPSLLDLAWKSVRRAEHEIGSMTMQACAIISCLHNHLAQTCNCGSSSGATGCIELLIHHIHGIQTKQSRNITVTPRISARRKPLYHRLEIWLEALTKTGSE